MGQPIRGKGRPRRRDLLAGGAGAAALAVLGCRTSRAAASGAPVATATAAPAAGVDVHCHTFCSADLPIVGFVAHYIPGLTDLSRLVTHWPELVVRTFVGAVATLPNAVAPDALLVQLTKHLPFSVGADKRRIVARYLEALYLVAHPRASISATLAQ